MLWTPCVAMLLLSFISLVDRSILGILSPVMLRELHLTAGQYGTAILVFSICYMLYLSVVESVYWRGVVMLYPTGIVWMQVNT